MVIFGPYNAFPNGEMEIFYLGECDLSDHMMVRSGGVLLSCEETRA